MNSMILVDKNIKQMISAGDLIICGYDVNNVNSISYDLTIGNFTNTDSANIEIIPGEFVIIRTKEKLKIPINITGRIGEKNSLLRLGLKVDGPQYQPGHTTYAFLRVQNVSDKTILLKVGMHIAQIYFEELKDSPDVPYSSQPGASFQNEVEYVGYGRYEGEFKKSIKSFEKVKEDIENASNRIYGNVLSLMGIIVAIFSLLIINYEAFTKAELSANYIIAMNLSVTFCITVMLGLILFLVNRWNKKGFTVIYAIILIFLCIATFIFCA